MQPMTMESRWRRTKKQGKSRRKQDWNTIRRRSKVVAKRKRMLMMVRFQMRRTGESRLIFGSFGQHRQPELWQGFFSKSNVTITLFSPTQVGGIPLSILKSSRPGVDVEVNAPRHLEDLDKLHLEDQRHHNHTNQGWRFSFTGSKLRPAEMLRPDPLPLQQQYLLATRPRLVFDAMIGDLNWSENYKRGLRVQRNGTLHGSQLGEPAHFMTSLNTISSLHTCH